MKIANPLYRPCPWEVGDILTTENATPPAQRWPGTQWEQIQDRFLLGAGVSYALGSEGGEARHTLTVEEMPAHSHRPKGWAYYFSQGGESMTCLRQADSPDNWKNLTTETGGNQPHNNLPPYRAVSIWRRTA